MKDKPNSRPFSTVSTERPGVRVCSNFTPMDGLPEIQLKWYENFSHFCECASFQQGRNVFSLYQIIKMICDSKIIQVNQQLLFLSIKITLLLNYAIYIFPKTSGPSHLIYMITPSLPKTDTILTIRKYNLLDIPNISP